jgi:hypothetical protein
VEDKQAKVYAFMGTKLYVRVYGEVPEDGRSLFISLHGGGGGGPKLAINDSNFRDWKCH